MSYHSGTKDLGCAGVFVIAVVIAIMLFGIAKCSMSVVKKVENEKVLNSSQEKRPSMQASWISYACKDSDGTIIQDPHYPGYYFDNRHICQSCHGTGKLPEGAVGRVLYEDDKCVACYGTGREKRRIPSNVD